MARRTGQPMYGNKASGKGIQGSYYITVQADRKLRAAARRTGKSRSNVIEYCIWQAADGLTKAEAAAIAALPADDQA